MSCVPALGRTRAWVTLGLALAASGCGDDDGSAAIDAGADAGAATDAGVDAAPTDAGAAGIAWEPCLLLGSGIPGECATVPLPADFRDPMGRTIGVRVARLRRGEGSRGQLWLLQGGPGGSSYAFQRFVGPLGDWAPDLDLYFPDHRGTGGSARLACPTEEDPGSIGGDQLYGIEVSGCADHLRATRAEDLPLITPTQAAHDLAGLIDLTREPGRPVFVYGVSYGTYWLNRYLQVRPDQVTGVIFDSLCPPGLCALHWDENHDAVAHQLFDACGVDPACSAHLGTDPWARLAALEANLAAGHCPELAADLGRPGLAALLALLVESAPLRGYGPALVYRYERCSPDDVTILRHAATAIFDAARPPPDQLSMPTNLNIRVSEMTRGLLPTLAEAELAQEGLLVTSRDEPFWVQAADVWPIYPADPLEGTFASTTIPVLSLNGTLDPQTPLAIARPLAEHFSGPHQTFVVVERAAHFVAGQGATVASVLGRELPCGASLLKQFVADPTATLDTSCATRTLPLEFSGNVALSLAGLGTTDLWDGAPVTPASRRTLQDVLDPVDLAALRASVLPPGRPRGR